MNELNIYNAEQYARTFQCSVSTAKTKISTIRSDLSEKGYSLGLQGRVVSDYMIYLYDETMLDIETVAEIKKANALEEIALALKEKPLAGTSDL